MTSSYENLPDYLRQYCVEQPADKYTPRDHATWRYIMRQSRDYFRDHAVPVYLEGLKRTGITIDHIPSIAAMDAKLAEIGWGAVPVCGFIPPAAFLDFQARRILPIAFDMRPIEQISYTPAPDIVHEAAGHAPILADPEYSDYLTLFATMARKAIFSRADLNLYEAIRRLSDTKANPDSSPAMVAAANAYLQEASAAVTFVSEANKVARMNWWTVEYGLMGSLTAPKIYGAGLLSSVGESQACLGAKVKKVPLSAACVDTSYDITEPQPQLFVAENIAHLKQALHDFEETLSFRRGGIAGLRMAESCRTLTTTTLDSGLQISGQVDEILAAPRSSRSGGTNHADSVEFVRWRGPVQLAHGGQELQGQGCAEHANGFSTPLGRFIGALQQPASELSTAQLEQLGLVAGRKALLKLSNGFTIEGQVVRLTRQDGKLILISWQDCKVQRQGQVYFAPEWGVFDQGIGEQITAVQGGAADHAKYGGLELGMATTIPSRTNPFDDVEKRLFAVYEQVRSARAAVSGAGVDVVPGRAASIVELMATVASTYPDEWLLRLETLELGHVAIHHGANGTTRQKLAAMTTSLLEASRAASANVQWLVAQGCRLVATAD